MNRHRAAGAAVQFERKGEMRNVIVVGCGRVGSRLANMLSENGSNVCVIDKSAYAFGNLGRGFNGSTVQGIGYDEDTLLKAGVEDCDVVAAVTESDNANLMVTEVASRLYDVPHVIARLYNPSHERAYMQLGIDYVCGTSLVAEEVFGKAISGHGAHLDTFGDYEVLRFSLNLSWTEKNSIRVSEIERDHDIRIIAFERSDGSASSIPTRDSILYQGDSVLACVRHDLIDSFSRFVQS
jgi:trk system potassium uptake protein TrkA